MKKYIQFLFVFSGKANLPELNYYSKLLKIFNPNIKIHKRKLSELQSKSFYDFIWIVMSNFPLNCLIYFLKNKKMGGKLIIDIRSSSVGRFSKIKDFVKIILILIIRPNYILFLNNSVKDRFKIISYFLNYQSLIIDMPFPDVDNDYSKNLDQNKKYRIFTVIKNINNFKEYFEIRNKIFSKYQINKDILVCKNKNLLARLGTEIKSRKIDVELISQLDTRKYHKYLSLSLVHFISYPNKMPYIQQTSTRVLDSILNKLFVISINSMPNKRAIDYYKYHKYAFLINNPNSYPDIHIKLPDVKDYEMINKRIKIYMKQYDKNVYKFFNTILN